MKRSFEVATAGGTREFAEAGRAGELEALLPGRGPWEIELGFGKGRFLLSSARADPETRWLGVEVAGEYFRLVARRLARRALPNVLLVRGEALALLATAVPSGLARALHVYFPDPWPKSRHQRRRLFSPLSLDLLIAALEPGGRLWFATDHLDYGREVRGLLASHPALEVGERESGWDEGPRTNYEAKYVAEGRPILRLEARRRDTARPHPAGEGELALGVPPAGPSGPA